MFGRNEPGAQTHSLIHSSPFHLVDHKCQHDARL